MDWVIGVYHVNYMCILLHVNYMCILLLCVLTLEVDIGAQTCVSGVSLVFNKNTAVSWLPDLKVEEARVQREKKTIDIYICTNWTHLVARWYKPIPHWWKGSVARWYKPILHWWKDSSYWIQYICITPEIYVMNYYLKMTEAFAFGRLFRHLYIGIYIVLLFFLMCQDTNHSHCWPPCKNFYNMWNIPPLYSM